MKIMFMVLTLPLSYYAILDRVFHVDLIDLFVIHVCIHVSPCMDTSTWKKRQTGRENSRTAKNAHFLSNQFRNSEPWGTVDTRECKKY